MSSKFSVHVVLAGLIGDSLRPATAAPAASLRLSPSQMT